MNYPLEISNILDSFNHNLCAYAECKRVTEELLILGYTAEYGLDGVLFDIVPINVLSKRMEE